MIFLLLLITFLKGMVYSSVLPIWQGPDEQAHFGQVANYAEIGKAPQSYKNLNEEIYYSELLFGTYRDEYGNNQFTFHPEHKIEYTNSKTGKFEDQISDFPKTTRKILTINEATNYPPFYYLLGALDYRLFYETNLFTRVFMVRLISILCIVGAVFLAYKSGKEIFNNNELSAITLAALVSFQPMVTYVGVTVNSDNLMTLLFSGGFYLGILMLKKGFQKSYLLAAVLIFILGVMTKPQFVLILPVWGFVYLVKLFQLKKNRKFWIQIGSLSAFAIIALIYLVKSYAGALHVQGDYTESPITFIKFTASHTLHEVLPWYWGVFDWLGVVYPIGVIRAINRILLIAVFGIILKIFLIIKRKQIQKSWPFFYLIFTSLVYFIGISVFDYLYMLSSHGISIGVQGRYFFPTIIAHMALLMIGFFCLVPTRLNNWTAKIMVFAMVLLNFFALFILLNIYYELNNLPNFFNELSQYKSAIYKYPFTMVWGVLYLLGLGIFLYKYIHLNHTHETVSPKDI
jgi:hypothetical protein